MQEPLPPREGEASGQKMTAIHQSSRFREQVYRQKQAAFSKSQPQSLYAERKSSSADGAIPAIARHIT
jgi:hypothetical protein